MEVSKLKKSKYFKSITNFQKRYSTTIKYTMKSDVVFKEVFSRKGNEDILISFLRAVLKIDIKSIKVNKDVSLMKEVIENKYGVLDVQATLNDETIVNIEMQVKEFKNMNKRLAFYAGKVYSTQIKEGSKYNDLKNIVSISIFDYEITPLKEYITEFGTYDKKSKKYELDIGQKYIYIELPKFRKENKDMNDELTQWLTFIDGTDRKGVELAMSKNSMIKKANEKMKYLTGSAKFRKIADLRQKSLMDYLSLYDDAMTTGYEDGRNEGMNDGIREGRMERNIQIAKSMLKEKMDVNVISKITTLPVEKILSLK